MTRRTNARLAGIVFLLYIVTGITSMVLSGQATGGAEGTVAKLASMAQHLPVLRLDILLTLLQAAYALVLAVTLYALTRDQDRDLAIMAMCCRVGEGLVIAALSTSHSLARLLIATSDAAGANANAAAGTDLGDLVLGMGGSIGTIAAICFAAGSTLFCYLFLRARSIPVPLAWLGVVGSILLVVLLPLRLAGFLEKPVPFLAWLPMLVFEVTLAFWLIFKGTTLPAINIHTGASA